MPAITGSRNTTAFQKSAAGHPIGQTVRNLNIDEWERTNGPIDWDAYPSELLDNDEATVLFRFDPTGYVEGLHPTTIRAMVTIYQLAKQTGAISTLPPQYAIALEPLVDVYSLS